MAKQKKIYNRELSWLSFNHRVLQEAADPTVPLVERIRFLGIFSNNLDEFFKVRVASVKRLIDIEKISKRPIKDKPKNLLSKIQKRVIVLQKLFEKTFEEIQDEMGKQGIFIIDEKELTPGQLIFVEQYFDEVILPAISPIMLRNVERFPPLEDKSISLCCKLSSSKNEIEPEYALIEIPTSIISRFIVLPPEGDKKFIILLDDVIRTCLYRVFSLFDFDTFEAYTIKLTRDAELDIDNDLTKSFLEQISKGVSGRKKGEPVRFIYDQNMPEDLINYLIRELHLDDEDNLIPGGRYHNFKDFIDFPNIGGENLEYSKTPPLSNPDIKPYTSILSQVAKKDILLYYPYHKFSHFIDLLREASIDPSVTTVKICLYRVAKSSKVTNALINAARNGKEVTVIMELRARFDEKSNIYWSRKLEEAGAQVVFGVPGLKVHSKICQISRKEGKSVKHYAVVSTGNFHESNARVYSDITLLTADQKISREVKKVFDFFENTFKNFTYKHLLVSPLYMRRRLLALIDTEIRNKQQGKDAYIFLKINNLVDNDMIKKLYKAGQAGVNIRLIVRGICSLLPGIPGFSENIEAKAVIDKYLEHSRVFVFCNNNNEQIYISSADWMTRNLDHRIEVATPINDPELKKELMKYMEVHWNDNVKSRVINDTQDNSYLKSDTKMPLRSQTMMYDLIHQNRF